jgi:RNA polymerase sigma-70 factor (ECF subfamily)
MNQEQTIILYQPMLQAIAYNIVRCKADAEDIVQETFLKWLTLSPQKIENTKAYLIKAVKNNCLNHLSTLRKKKEELFSQHNFAEIFGRFKETSLGHLDFDVEMNKALKVLQSKLEPLERAVYLLKRFSILIMRHCRRPWTKKRITAASCYAEQKRNWKMRLPK